MHQSQARGANGTPNRAAGRRRSWETQTTRTSERHAVTPPTLSADRAVARTSSLLSLYEAQSVEHVAGIRRDNSGPYLDDDDALGPSRGHTPAGWPGGGAQDSLTLAGQEQLSVLVATSGAEKTTPSGGAAGAMDYPWSDERRASGSRGSGGGARHIVEGGTRLDAAAATVSGSPRWDDVLNVGQQLDQARGTSANEGEEHPRRRRVSVGTGDCGGYGDRDEIVGIARNEIFPSTTETSVTAVAGGTQSCNIHTHATASYLDDDCVDLGHEKGGDVGGGAGTRLGGRFDLWNESDDEVNVTEADRYEPPINGERRNEDHASGSDSQACEGGGALDSGDDGGHAMDSFLMPAQGTGFPVTAQAGGFFDAATSSADKVGREGGASSIFSQPRKHPSVCRKVLLGSVPEAFSKQSLSYFRMLRNVLSATKCYRITHRQCVHLEFFSNPPRGFLGTSNTPSGSIPGEVKFKNATYIL